MNASTSTLTLTTTRQHVAGNAFLQRLAQCAGPLCVALAGWMSSTGAGAEEMIVIPGNSESAPASALQAHAAALLSGAPHASLPAQANAGTTRAASAHGPAAASNFSPTESGDSGIITIPGPGETSAAGHTAPHAVANAVTNAPHAGYAVTNAPNAAPALPVRITPQPPSAQPDAALRPPGPGTSTLPPAGTAGLTPATARQVAPAAASQATPARRPAPAALAPNPQADAIRQTALDFLRQQTVGLPGKVGIEISPSAPRGLAACDALTGFLPPGARLWGRTTVGVRCTGERPWTLYVQARISVQATYYVAGREISPGQAVEAQDLVAREGDLANLPQSVVTDAAQVVGAVAQNRITAGLPLRRDMLRAAVAVQQGQTVKLVAQGPGFAVTTDGSALGNAATGQQVKVRTHTGQIVSGIVRGSDTVEIML